MSIMFDDHARDIIVTRNGKTVMVDTSYVPWPLGHGYETQVFHCSASGNITKGNAVKPLDEKQYGESKTAADKGHAKMVNKWMKEVLV